MSLHRTFRRTISDMKEHLVERSKQNLLYIVLFAAAFVIIGQLFPKIYFQYFDNKQYYVIKEVETATRVIKQCDSLEFHLSRHSEVLSRSIRTISLVFIDENGNSDKEYEIQQSGNIEPGDSEVSFFVDIPCNLKPQTYRAHIVTNYELRGIDKFAEGTSNQFDVIPKDGTN